MQTVERLHTCVKLTGDRGLGRFPWCMRARAKLAAERMHTARLVIKRQRCNVASISGLQDIQTNDSEQEYEIEQNEKNKIVNATVERK
jgi:hypothetical protein